VLFCFFFLWAELPELKRYIHTHTYSIAALHCRSGSVVRSCGSSDNAALHRYVVLCVWR